MSAPAQTMILAVLPTTKKTAHDPITCANDEQPNSIKISSGELSSRKRGIENQLVARRFTTFPSIFGKRLDTPGLENTPTNAKQSNSMQSPTRPVEEHLAGGGFIPFITRSTPSLAVRNKTSSPSNSSYFRRATRVSC